MADHTKKFLSLKYIGAELGELMELKALVRQRIRFLEENKDKISLTVFERLIAEYNSYLGGLDCELTVGLSDYEVRLAEIRVFANQLETLKRSFADSLQEIKLRYAIGEFDKETFELKSTEHEKRLKAFEQGILKYSGQQKKISQFLEKVYESGAISPADIMETLEGFEDSANLKAPVSTVDKDFEPEYKMPVIETSQVHESELAANHGSELAANHESELAANNAESMELLDEEPVVEEPDIKPERKFSIVEEDVEPAEEEIDEPITGMEEESDDENDLSETDLPHFPGLSNSLLDGLDIEKTEDTEDSLPNEVIAGSEREDIEFDSLENDLVAGGLLAEEQEENEPKGLEDELESEIVNEINPEELHPFEEEKLEAENKPDSDSQSIDLDALMGVASSSKEPEKNEDISVPDKDDILSGHGANSDKSQSLDSLMGLDSSSGQPSDAKAENDFDDSLLGGFAPEKEKQSNETSGMLTDFLDMNISVQPDTPKAKENVSTLEQIEEQKPETELDQPVEPQALEEPVMDESIQPYDDLSSARTPVEDFAEEDPLDEKIIVQQFEDTEDEPEPEMNIPSMGSQQFSGKISEESSRESVNGSGSRSNVISIDDEIAIEADPSRQEDDAQLLSINQTLDAIKKKTVKCRNCGTLNYAIRWYCEKCEEPLTSL